MLKTQVRTLATHSSTMETCVCALLGACVLLSSAAAGGDVPSDQRQIGYSHDVRPILAKNCFECHGGDEQAREADLRLDQPSVATSELSSGETAIVPGQPDASALVARIFADDDDTIMPPTESKKALNPYEKQLLKDWIAQGAKYEQHWAFVRPKQHDLPPVKNRQQVRNEIDSFVVHELEQRGLSLAPEADRRTLIRRLYFDLVGLPPSPHDVEKFLAEESPEAYEQLVDRLLASPRYGERWARHWLDLARYADTAGYEGDQEYPHTWRYRDYAIDALNSDKPYDEFIIEQIAGDELEQVTHPRARPDPDPENKVALTFLRLAPFTEPRGEESRDILLSEMTSTVGSVFLGLTVGCAKCHDHKYDQIPTKDFYRLKAFFATVEIAQPREDDAWQLGGSSPAPFYRPGEQERMEKEQEAAQDRLEDAEQEVEGFRSALRTRLTEALGLSEPVDDERLNEELGDSDSKVITKADREKQTKLNAIVTQRGVERHRAMPQAMTLTHTAGPPYGPGAPTSYVQVRGQFDQPGEIVEPGFLSAITGHQQPADIPLDPFKRWPTRSWRKTLAEWIASGDNPLTARVMVNRIWQHHFARGIVATPSDFGMLGEAPTHPELLDWLALEFVKQKWSIKAMHRLMVTSATYRQASRLNSAAAEAVDPGNDLLWRQRRQRLEGEAIRDSLLAVSGRLNIDSVGGLPIFPPMPQEIEASEAIYNVGRWQTQRGHEGRRRSVYIYQQRSMNVPMLDTFDCGVPNSSSASRRTSVTPLQALVMYNGELVNDEAKHFAERLRREAGKDADSRIRHAFQLALARDPTQDELVRMRDFLSRPPSIQQVKHSNQQAAEHEKNDDGDNNDGLVGLCRMLLNTSEFIYVD